jgi:hypothetical protein
LNELTSLLKRVFEAFGYSQGDYEDAAHAIAWLEARALDGLELVTRDWQRLARTGAALELLSSSNDAEVLDARDCSVLTVGRSIADLAAATLEQQGQSRVEVRGCYSRIAILPSLDVCARRGAGVVAHWHDGNYQHVARIDAGSVNPEYRRMTMKPDNNASAATLNLVCHTQVQEVNAVVAELSASTAQSAPDRHVLPAQMEAHYRTAVQHGLAISEDLLARLSTAAEAVLVAATEQSRLGAGEAV